jgi:hypothetical protein
VGDWVVWAVEQPGGIARLEHRNGLTEVVVADAPRSADDEDPGFTAVACTVDGAALVVCHAAPPALVVGSGDCHTAPAQPGGRELISLSLGERLLILSSSVLEARPLALSRALQEPGRLMDRDPVSVLAALFHEVQHGAGVVLGRSFEASGTRKAGDR